MRFGRLLTASLTMWLAACSAVDFTRPGSPLAGISAVPPGSLNQYFAEFCALSQILQRPGSAAMSRGDIGGHSVFYLNGACRVAVRGQTRIQLCDEPGAEPADGVGLSMNAHFRNAKWVATPGRDFFLNGNQAPGQPLTRANHAAVMAEAQRLRLYDGIIFHPEVFAAKPPGVTPEDWMQEVSVATDYGISLGRGRFCARVPVNRAQMAAMVNFLNQENVPYRDQGRIFNWNLFKDNCIHLAHNALAAAGLWQEWPTGRPWLVSVLDFPVPRNEFVNLMLRVADVDLLDPYALHADPAARHALLTFGQLPVRAGALMESRPPQQPNQVYETELKMIFYDPHFIGPYPSWFDAIQSDPTQHQPHANQAWVTGQHRLALAQRQPLEWWLPQLTSQQRAGFAETYERFYALLQRDIALAEPRLVTVDTAEAR